MLNLKQLADKVRSDLDAGTPLDVGKAELEKILEGLKQLPAEDQKKHGADLGMIMLNAFVFDHRDHALALLNHGADVNAKGSNDINALSIAIANQDHHSQLELIKHGASRDSLLPLINNTKTLSTVPANVISNLFDYLHPDQKMTSSLTLLDAYHLTRSTGNIIGLNQNIPLSDQSDGTEIAVRGNLGETSQRRLIEFLKQYNQSDTLEGKPEKQQFELIEVAFTRSNDLMKKNTSSYLPDAHHQLNSDYHKGELVCISSGWSEPIGHAVEIALYGKYLIYANRGPERDQEGGAVIYEIPDNIQVTPEFIKKLMHDSNKTREDFKETLKELRKEENVVARFPSKKQEHGNCSFANPKASIEPMLILLKNNKQDKENIIKLAQEHISEENRSAYKGFTRFVRDNQFDLLGKVATLAQTPEMKSFYINLVKGIVSEHSGDDARTDEKKEEEINRLVTLVDQLPLEMNRVIREKLPQEIREKLSSDGGVLLATIPPALKDKLSSFNSEIQRVKGLSEDLADDRSISKLSAVFSEDKTELSYKDLESLKDALKGLEAKSTYLQQFKSDPDVAQMLEEMPKIIDLLKPLVAEIEKEVKAKTVEVKPPHIQDKRAQVVSFRNIRNPYQSPSIVVQAKDSDTLTTSEPASKLKI